MTDPVRGRLGPAHLQTSSAEDENLVEGMSVRVTATASRPVSADTEVMPVRDGASSAGDDDYELDPMTVAIGAGRMLGHTMASAVEGRDGGGSRVGRWGW